MLMGESGGGGLAACTALALRDRPSFLGDLRRRSPAAEALQRPAGAILLSPMLVSSAERTRTSFPAARAAVRCTHALHCTRFEPIRVVPEAKPRRLILLCGAGSATIRAGLFPDDRRRLRARCQCRCAAGRHARPRVRRGARGDRRDRRGSRALLRAQLRRAAGHALAIRDAVVRILPLRPPSLAMWHSTPQQGTAWCARGCDAVTAQRRRASAALRCGATRCAASRRTWAGCRQS